METFKSVDEVLDFAVASEEEAADYYNHLADRMERPWMADMFKGFAREEMGHKAKLLAVKQGGQLRPSEVKIQDLKIADYTVDVPDRPGMDYQDALILAMKREKAAFKLYTNLADTAATDELRQTFLALAQEEAKHKLRMELEYDQNVLGEN